MWLAALAAALVAAAILTVRDAPHLASGLGDTDDAMRLVLMRDLLGGGGWYDQLVARLQPPMGLQMHWSRLIDGGMAALDRLFRLAMPDAGAEMATRIVWPMLWILPAAVSVLAVARRLAGGAAVFACAILLMTELTLYLQFRPGRVDHHGVQIALFLVAFGGAAMGSRRGAWIAGLASGLGLAVGLEAMIFEIVIGAFFALAYLFGRDLEGRRLGAYAAGLGLATAGAFLVQTPPHLWTAAACDAIAVNLVAGVVVAALGLIAAVRLTRHGAWPLRLGALALAGAAAAAAYLGLDSHCLAGPFADVDPRLKSFWLQYVQEIRPIPAVWSRNRATAFELMTPAVMGLIGWAWLGRDRYRREDPVWMLCGALLLLGAAAGFSAIRMATYGNWIAMPVLAAAVTDLVDRYARGLMLVLAAAALAITPLFFSSAIVEADKRFLLFGPAQAPAAKAASAAAAPATAAPRPAPVGSRGDRCFQKAAFAELAAQPPGLVLAEVDLGPFILAYTGSSAMAAPYHRMAWGLVSAREAMSAGVGEAEAKVRALGVRYVLACPAHGRNVDRRGMPADALQRRVDAGRPPAWLEPLGPAGTLRLYRVRP